MATGDSTIIVRLVGDAKSLDKTLATTDARIGGLLKGAVIGGGALVVGDKIVELAGQALDAADKFDDALSTLQGNTSPEFAAHISDISDDFTNIGLSAPQVASLASSWAALATAAGVSEPAIEKLTPDILDIAKAVSAQTGKTVDEVVNDIGAAARGNQRAVNDYGVVIDTALNPDASILDILDQLKTKFGDATTAVQDNAGAQDILNAKWDNFILKIGEAIKGPIRDLQLGLIYTSDTILPDLGTGLETLGDKFGVWGRDALSPVNLVADALGGLGDLINNINTALNGLGGSSINEHDIINRQNDHARRNGLDSVQGRP